MSEEGRKALGGERKKEKRAGGRGGREGAVVKQIFDACCDFGFMYIFYQGNTGSNLKQNVE